MGEPGLEVAGLTVAFGGLRAVDGVDLTVPTGAITGLIGPNGAGKTTTFNACTGLLRPTAGQVRLRGHDVTTAPPEVRARLGLGRTFQRMQLFDSLDVATNVALGREARLVGRAPWRHLVRSRARAAEVAEAAEEAMARCGLEALARRSVGSLSTGERRLVELGRAVAGGFELLLLDEPSSGLDHEESAAFGEVLLGLVRDRGTGILLVEHDMALVMAVCHRIAVLEFGRLLFEGTAAETRASDVVRQAYLGSTA